VRGIQINTLAVKRLCIKMLLCIPPIYGGEFMVMDNQKDLAAIREVKGDPTVAWG
jgi:hypothetical protein